jgi:iron complex transport system substrate-binding protein
MRRAVTAILAAAALGACSATGATTSAATTQTTQATAQSTTTAESPTTFPVTIEAANGAVTIPKKPVAIVSLSPTATETLYAIGAGSQVLAVDDQSNYPEDAPITDLSGFTPNIEAIASYDPDLVVIMFDPGDLIDSLTALGIPVLMQPAAATLQDAYDQIGQLGAATGNAAEAETLLGSIQTDIAQTIADSSSDDTLAYYFELDPSYYTVTSSTFIGSLLASLGLENIADAADSDGYGYPQLSSEYIIDANPDLVILADTICCGQDEDAVASRPGWDSLDAITKGNIVPLNDNVASRWGPRITDLLDTVAAAVREARGR